MQSRPLTIRQDDLSGAKIRALIEAHLANSAIYSPPEAIHALNADGLLAPGVTVWSVWQDEALLGMGGLKELSPTMGEVKSMHTAAAHRGQGVAETMLLHLIAEARRRGYRQLYLETGSQEGYAASRGLYAKHGFAYCEPFGDYRADPNSVFMTLSL